MFSLLTLSSDANFSPSVLLHLTFSHLHHAQLCTPHHTRYTQTSVQKVIVSHISVIVHGAARSFGSHKNGFKAVVILYTPYFSHIFEECRGASVPATFDSRPRCIPRARKNGRGREATR